MNLLKYSATELFVCPEEDVAWTSREVRDAAQSGASSFIRRMCLEYKGPEKDLGTVLRLAKLVTANACDLMRVGQVNYDWGIAPISQHNVVRLGRNYHNQHELLPDGYALVACVDNVVEATSLSPYQYQKIETWKPYGLGLQLEDGTVATNYDLRTEQFVEDPTKEEWDKDRVIGVDLEPRLRLSS